MERGRMKAETTPTTANSKESADQEERAGEETTPTTTSENDAEAVVTGETETTDEPRSSSAVGVSEEITTKSN